MPQATSRPLPSNRSFGLLFTVVFLVIALWPLIHAQGPRLWALPIAALIALVTFFAPERLTPFNRAWMKLAEILHKITSPVILGLMFFGIILPIGAAMRLFGRDELELRVDPKAGSYWRDRAGHKFDFDSFKRPF